MNSRISTTWPTCQRFTRFIQISQSHFIPLQVIIKSNQTLNIENIPLKEIVFQIKPWIKKISLSKYEETDEDGKDDESHLASIGLQSIFQGFWYEAKWFPSSTTTFNVLYPSYLSISDNRKLEENNTKIKKEWANFQTLGIENWHPLKSIHSTIILTISPLAVSNTTKQ